MHRRNRLACSGFFIFTARCPPGRRACLGRIHAECPSACDRIVFKAIATASSPRTMLDVPLRLLRFCRRCLKTRQTATRETCEACGGELLPLLDENGALCRDFLLARGSCCDTGCRNCPYRHAKAVGNSGAGRAQEKICQRCRARFECCSGGCWCERVRLSAATLAWLERNFTDCLCPSCLAEFAAA